MSRTATICCIQTHKIHTRSFVDCVQIRGTTRTHKHNGHLSRTTTKKLHTYKQHSYTFLCRVGSNQCNCRAHQHKCSSKYHDKRIVHECCLYVCCLYVCQIFVAVRDRLFCATRGLMNTTCHLKVTIYHKHFTCVYTCKHTYTFLCRLPSS